MGVTGDQAHRALDDASATMELLFFLWDKAIALPPPLLNEIVSLARRTPQAANRWQALPIFDEALALHGPFATAVPLKVAEFPPDDASIPPLKAVPAPAPLKVDKVLALLDEGGTLKLCCPLMNTVPSRCAWPNRSPRC